MNYELREYAYLIFCFRFCAKVIAKVLLFFEIKKCFFSCFFLQICKYRVFNMLHTAY